MSYLITSLCSVANFFLGLNLDRTSWNSTGKNCALLFFVCGCVCSIIKALGLQRIVPVQGLTFVKFSFPKP